MDQIRISDVTMKQSGKDFSLSFKEKIEIPKLLDKLGVSVIELEPVVQAKIDALRIKSVASTVKNSVVAVPVQLTQESVDEVMPVKEKEFTREIVLDIPEQTEKKPAEAVEESLGKVLQEVNAKQEKKEDIFEDDDIFENFSVDFIDLDD